MALTQSEIIEASGNCRKVWEDKFHGVERINCWCGKSRERPDWVSHAHWHAIKMAFIEKHSPVFRHLRKQKATEI